MTSKKTFILPQAAGVAALAIGLLAPADANAATVATSSSFGSSHFVDNSARTQAALDLQARRQQWQAQHNGAAATDQQTLADGTTIDQLSTLLNGNTAANIDVGNGKVIITGNGTSNNNADYNNNTTDDSISQTTTIGQTPAVAVRRNFGLGYMYQERLANGTFNNGQTVTQTANQNFNTGNQNFNTGNQNLNNGGGTVVVTRPAPRSIFAQGNAGRPRILTQRLSTWVAVPVINNNVNNGQQLTATQRYELTLLKRMVSRQYVAVQMAEIGADGAISATEQARLAALQNRLVEDFGDQNITYTPTLNASNQRLITRYQAMQDSGNTSFQSSYDRWWTSNTNANLRDVRVGTSRLGGTWGEWATPLYADDFEFEAGATVDDNGGLNNG